jgi:YHYH protein
MNQLPHSESYFSMKTNAMLQWFVPLAVVTALLAACGGSSDSDTSSTTTTTTATTGTQAGVKTAHFLAGGLSSSITTVSCTLSGGTTTSCYRIVTKGAASDHAVGPFCPTNVYSDVASKTLSTDASNVGMWIDGGKTYSLAGQFIANLATFYNSTSWQMFDATTGAVKITDTQAMFTAAAQPNVPAALANHCVEGKMSYVGGGVSRTFLIPVTPVALSSGTGSVGTSGVGVSLSGIVMDGPAPTSHILAGLTIAAFDPNGGHINPVAGYHYHAATGKSHQVASTHGHSALMGYALDGYGIYAQKDTSGAEARGLDNCRGHTDAVRGYHYHAAMWSVCEACKIDDACT